MRASGKYYGFNTTQADTLSRLVDDAVLVAGAVDTAALANNSVTSAKIVDGTIVNADINATAAIDATKLHNAAGTSGLTASDLQTTIQALRTYMVNLNVWAAALAAKLNADAGVTDTNYDIDPQS